MKSSILDFYIFTWVLIFPGPWFFHQVSDFVNIFLEDLAKLLLFVNINTEIWKWVNSTENIRKYTSKLPKILWISTRFLFEYTFVRNEMTVVSVENECRNHFWTQWCAFSSRQTLPAFLSVLILVYSRWIPGKASTKKSCAFVLETMPNECLLQENNRLKYAAQTLIMQTPQDFYPAPIRKNNLCLPLCGSYHLRLSKRGNINLQYM